VGEGTGLGLSIVHGIVTDCDGGIILDSEAGRGSTFTVFLPVAEKPSDVNPFLDEESATGTERIMVVDDEKPIGKMLGEALRMLGYRVFVFHDSLEALQAFQTAPDAYDLVITDSSMPGMTGQELGGSIWKVRPGFPVLLMTGYSEELDEMKARRLGFANLLKKPIPLEKLAKAMRQTLDEPQARKI
jgi:CheY-like chemotaxis protein